MQGDASMKEEALKMQNSAITISKYRLDEVESAPCLILQLAISVFCQFPFLHRVDGQKVEPFKYIGSSSSLSWVLDRKLSPRSSGRGLTLQHVIVTSFLKSK